MNAEQQIDRVLIALGGAQPPEGLKDRISRRLAKAAESQNFSSSIFAVAGRSVWAMRRQLAACALASIAVAAVFLSLRHEHAHSSNQPAELPTPPPLRSEQASLERAVPTVTALPHTAPAATLKRQRVLRVSAVQANDARALEETLAPRLLAPAMPLSQQERELRRATRSRRFTELADLEPAREAELHAALQARQQTQIDGYIERMLAPLAAAEALNPTSADDSESASAP